MLFTIQRLFGYGLLLFGFMSLIFGDFPVKAFGTGLIVAGFVLISLAELVEIQKGNYHRTLGLPYTKADLNIIISRSEKKIVKSETLKIHPLDETEYPLIRLNGEQYLRAKAFINYMKQNEMEYTFEFPNKTPIILDCTYSYFPGVKLFGFQDQVFVMLSELPLTTRVEGELLLVEAASE